MNTRRWTQIRTFWHAVSFVAGFGLVFLFLGVAASALGALLANTLLYVQRIGGIILIAFGLVTIGGLNWIVRQIHERPTLAESGVGRTVDFLTQVFYSERRLHLQTDKRGYGVSMLTGVIFAAGWTPCAGPILSAILLLAAKQGTITHGAFLLGMYTVGLAVPFLAVGAAFDVLGDALRHLNRHARIVSLISGIFLVGVGWLLLTDQLIDVSTQMVLWLGGGFISPEILNTSGSLTGVSASIALLAGVLSFFSPCVLPLVPAYIGFLSGTTVAGRANSAVAAENPA